MSGYMHPGWDGVKPWQDILPDTPPPEPARRKASHHPVPASPEPGPERPGYQPAPARVIPRWEAAQLAGSDCVGPGADWDRGDDE